MGCSGKKILRTHRMAETTGKTLLPPGREGRSLSLFVVPGWDSWYNNPKILTGSVPGKFAARLVPGRARKNFLAKIQGSPHKLDLDCRKKPAVHLS